MNEKDTWCDILEPPPGGLPRLVAAVQQRRTSARWPAFAIAASATACVMAIGAAIYRHAEPQRRLDNALHAAIAARDTVRVTDGAALEMPSARTDMRLFIVARIERPASD